ncbi:hypothetical protein K1719_044961 [Acacia pycnantha]|nr:hypothetical protein K1719_044961 [Acacia pycnantha]
MDDNADKGAPPPADSHDDHDQLMEEDKEEKSQMPVVTGSGSSSSGGGHGGSSTTTTPADSHDDHYQLMEEEKSQMPVVTGSSGGGSSTTTTPTIPKKKRTFEVGDSSSIGDIQAKVAKKSGNDEEDENANKEYAEDGRVDKSIASWLKNVPDYDEEQDLAEHQDLKVPQDDLSEGKTPKDIRKMFNIKNDFTPEEQERLRRQNPSCSFD